MCGIAGFIPKQVNFDRQCILNSMLTRIHHRGPDECGIYLSDDLCMGNVRLSIIDLKSGQQPLSTADGRYWIAYNGEVFNYPELKKKLEAKGHSFKTNCDTEIVLHMYEEYGVKCLEQLNGQFAFSIWDSFNKELFLARDRMGIRPLYYSNSTSSFVYASEIKSIFEYPEVERKLDAEGLSQVFTFWTSQSPQTAFEGISELPPGHYAILKNGNLNIKPYWQLSFDKPVDISLGDAVDQFRELFKDSLSLRMRADVPVAAYLSGGIDSTSTTAFIKQMFPEALNTFSIGFEEKDFDESIFQTEVANYFDTKHHSVSFNNSDVVDLFEKVIWHTEIPVLRTAPFPMYKLSKLVRDSGIKVVITGEGADEMLGGYNIFKEVLIRHFWAKFPNSKIRPLLLKKLYPYLPQINDAGTSVLKMFFGYKLSETDSSVYSHLLRWNNTSRINGLLSNDYKEQLNGSDWVANYANRISPIVENYSPIAKAQYIESNVFMSGYLLSSQGDRVAMGNSVEGRYPFLDHRIVEFCSKLPDHLKISGLDEKYLLKQVVKDVIPNSVLKRPKQAYRAPIAQALLNDKSGFVNDYLSEGKIKDSGIFDTGNTLKLTKKLRNNPNSNEMDNMALMGMLSTQILNDLYIKNFRQLKENEINSGRVMNNYYSKKN
ncbi:asparagine synthase (glutamine-hydrolyzing) [Labilibacter marinus]|uniref:asparagine synthase (glutamine-hydrolyzing) n=1 Tax=Labilibacter marinus TaxID=1477105 RepID=UPI00082B3EB9|nr:asparagine synthase (glutamine-hydrolyzing) [Labilibacter marinus]